MNIDLSTIFKQTFGQELPNKFIIEPNQVSQLGQKYFETDVFGRSHFLPVFINNNLIPFAVVSMSWKKNYVTTPMPDRGGNVHELINIEDYKFNIKGLLVSDNNTYPESQIIDLHNLFSVNESLELRCVLTDIVLKGTFSHSVVVKEIKWPIVQGIENVKPFEMDLESDNAFTLTLSD